MDKFNLKNAEWYYGDEKIDVEFVDLNDKYFEPIHIPNITASAIINPPNPTIKVTANWEGLESGMEGVYRLGEKEYPIRIVAITDTPVEGVRDYLIEVIDTD